MSVAIRHSADYKRARGELPDKTARALTSLEDHLEEHPDSGNGHLQVTRVKDNILQAAQRRPPLWVTYEFLEEKEEIRLLSVAALQPGRVFVSYSRADGAWLTRLEETMARQFGRAIDLLWTDRKIPEGADWSETIEQQLWAAIAALVLLSDDALSSDFIIDRELEALRDRSDISRLLLKVRPCELEGSRAPWLDRLQMLYTDSLQEVDPEEQDERLVAVAKRLLDLTLQEYQGCVN